MRSIARFCYTRRRLVLLTWIGMIVGLFALSSVAGGTFRTDFKLPGSESQEALDLLEARGASERTGFSGQIVIVSANGIDNPAVRARMEQFFDDITSTIDGVSINSPWDAGYEFQVAPDGRIAFAEINVGDRPQEAYEHDGITIREMAAAIDVPGLQVELGGDIRRVLRA